MKPGKAFKHALGMVLHSKLRSWLTILGIVIGVAAVIAIVSLGEGMQAQLSSRLSGLGSDIITLSPGFSRGGFFGGGGGGGPEGGGARGGATTKPIVLDRTDVQSLRGVADILYIDTEIRGNVNVSYLGRAGSVSLSGVDQRYWPLITTSTVSAGRMLGPDDQNVILIGGGLASNYFSHPVGINKVLTIEGKAFRVVGILNDQSRNIIMPISTAFQVIPNQEQGQYNQIIIKIRDPNNLNQSMTTITNKLIVSRHVTPGKLDFSLTSSLQLAATLQQTVSAASMFLLAIAGVSLIVGAIGIANTMFTSVLEKTKEIGIMKSIGARNKDILMIFLMNSALIGLVGGILGVILGALLSSLLPSLLGGLPFGRIGDGGAILSVNAVITALVVSMCAGIAAGLIPAYNASKLKPVDALRFE